MSSKYFDPIRHIDNLVDSSYYKDLIVLRNSIEIACDNYFQSLGAPKIDLFMIAKGVSSPMGKGSDSEPVHLKLGEQNVFLVDSAQFGMEPLVQKDFDMVYCYLPSFRGENSDDRHLSQFYHCESELRGDYNHAIDIAEGLIKSLLKEIKTVITKKNLNFDNNNIDLIDKFVNNKFPRIKFDEVSKILSENGFGETIEDRDYGRVITGKGELKAVELISNNELPIWITDYDRDVVPFYQKPDPNNPNKVFNADLILPSARGSFGGEVLGLGQRQDSKESLLESMKRQGINTPESYGWYMKLRERDDYQKTSGFGMGVERLLAWSLGLRSIVDAAIYPVLKNVEVKY